MAKELLKARVQKLQTEKEVLELEKRQGNAELAKAQEEARRFREENERLAREVTELLHVRDRAAASKKEKKELIKRVAALEDEVERLTQTISDRNEEVEIELDTLQADLAEETMHCDELAARCTQLDLELETVRMEKELECLKAAENERSKWEAREARLVAQLKGQKDASEGMKTQSPSLDVTTTHVTMEDEGGKSSQMLLPAWSAQQLPTIPKFSGESLETETFEDWLEHFKLLAKVCHWDKPAKLLNLTMRLKGQAFSFFRSCTPEQRSDYDVLVSELSKRFKPVRIQSVQSSNFHERKQAITRKCG